jgi:hypothetical protein
MRRKESQAYCSSRQRKGCQERGRKLCRILEPSRGGMGRRLKTARTRLTLLAKKKLDLRGLHLHR